MFGVNCTLDVVLQSHRRLISSERVCSVGQEISTLAKCPWTHMLPRLRSLREQCGFRKSFLRDSTKSTTSFSQTSSAHTSTTCIIQYTNRIQIYSRRKTLILWAWHLNLQSGSLPVQEYHQWECMDVWSYVCTATLVFTSSIHRLQISVICVCTV